MPACAGTKPTRYPATLHSIKLAEQRLTRVGENSACKLHAILQKKFPATLALLGTFDRFANDP
jgi:hypothetical protein